MLNDFLLPNLASLHWFWQSTLCIGLGLLCSFLLRQRPTHAHQVLFWSMTAAIILPVLSAAVKHYNLGFLQPEPTKTTSISIPTPEPIPVAPVETALPTAILAYQDSLPVSPWDSQYEFDSMGAANYDTEITERIYSAKLRDDPATQTFHPSPTVSANEAQSLDRTFWAVGGWVLITTILGSRLLVYFVKGMRLLQKSQPLDSQGILLALERAKSKLHVRQSVSIYQSSHIKTPVIWCWFSKPILLIPYQAEQKGKKIDWVSVFCHELAHWKRRDHWSCLAAEVLVCIFWPNPLMWWAKQRLIRLSEQACDDWVVAAGQSKTDYADSLLNLVPQGRLILVPTVIGGKNEMKKRIKRILQDRGNNPRISSRGTWLIGILSLGLALGLALTQTRADEREEPGERERITREKDEERIVHPEAREREERDVRFRELSRALEELKDAERNTKRRLKGLRDGQDYEARELEEQIRRIQREMSDVKRALYESTREKQGYRERESAERAEHRQILAREMLKLRERAQDIEREMEELGDRHPEKRRELQNELREIHERLNNLKRDMQGFDRDLQQRDAHREELMIHSKNLQERLEHLKRELKETDNDEKAHQLKRELEQTAAELRQVERQLQQERPDRERPERAEMERHLAKLKDEIRHLTEVGRLDEAERLERQAREIMQHLKEHPDEPRPPREPEMLYFQPRPDLERQIEELRGQVGEMRQEMKEIRNLLQQLLEQRREP
jgi:bla regulator protein BlaR1